MTYNIKMITIIRHGGLGHEVQESEVTVNVSSN